MKTTIAFAVAALGVALATTGQATTLTEYGTLATVSTFDCTGEDCGADAGDAVLLLTTLSVDPVVGGTGVTSSTAATGTTTTWPYPAGSASGTATVSSGLGIPVIRAAAASESMSWLGGQALAIQAYEYTGPGETLSLTWTLDGNITNPDDDPLTGLVLFTGFFSASELSAFPDLDPGGTGTPDPFLAYALLTSLALGSPADNFLEFTADGAVAEMGAITIDVATGDEFYLAMGLTAGAGGSGAAAESLSTLTASFAGAPALTPAFTATPASTVPEPAALLLLTGGLGVLLCLRRRGSA